MDTQHEVLERVRSRLKMRLAELLQESSSGEGEVTPKKLKEQLRQVLRTVPPKDYRQLHISRQTEEDQFLQDVLDESFAADPLERLLADESINEVMINGPHEVFVEREGRMERIDLKFTSERHLMAVLERMLDEVGLSVNESNPVCDARLPDGSRMNIIMHPVVLNGPVVTIRRKASPWTMKEFVSIGALSDNAADFLRACMQAKVNMVISGGTSTGKTTLVSVLSSMIPPQERIITIENVSELELPAREHWIRLVGRAPNLEGRGEISLRLLVRNALRMRPDRIILGEARGGEAFDVVQAMHTGHDGFMTILHANSARAALERLQMLMLLSGIDLPTSTCQMQIASAVDLVVHMARFVDGSRRVASISQVLGASKEGYELEDLFVFEMGTFSDSGQVRGEHRYMGARPKFMSKFQMNNVEVPAWLAT